MIHDRILGLLFILLGIILLSSIFILPVSAAIINNSAEIELNSIPYNHAIMFSWNLSQPVIIIPDGQIIINTTANSYLMDNIEPNSKHFIYLWVNESMFYSENYPLSSSIDNIWQTLDYYKYLLIGWLCIFLALGLRRSFIIALIGETLGIIGFIFALNSEIDIGYWGKIIYLIGLAGLTFFVSVIIQGGG